MPLRSYPYTLELAHPFTLATSSRTTTPALMVEWEHEGLTGYGEAAMPPYLGETPASAAAFLKLVDPAAFPDLQQIATIGAHIDALAPGNPAAKAALDLALHDWVGKKLNTSWHRHWGLDLTRIPATSFTIGIDTPAVVRQKTLAAAPYKILKVKLGRDTDRELITTIRQVTDKPLTVDANQGWCDREDALRMSEWLATQGVLFIEQPMPKEQIDDTAWLRERSPLPLIADESVQRLVDVPAARGVFDGINIKLMKCTGLHEAHQMITLARQLNLKVMLGCMTETSCAISAAAQLSPLVDWADLDGALLIKNDLFTGAQLVDGKIIPTDEPGLGLTKCGIPSSP
jgi:L-alanine-DL-glutamate epimerase-like enolase superfamily enzyme